MNVVQFPKPKRESCPCKCGEYIYVTTELSGVRHWASCKASLNLIARRGIKSVK